MKGGSYPDLALILSIADFFGIFIDQLFGYHKEKETSRRTSPVNYFSRSGTFLSL